jgi:hypothetical protein
MSKRFIMAFTLALIGLADNVSTALGVYAFGVKELNPIVNFFLINPIVFALFTVLKCTVMFFIAYMIHYNSIWDYLFYAVVLIFFCRATLINILNFTSKLAG